MVFLAEYVWIGGNNELRSKAKVMHSEVRNVEDLPEWNFDGSSTNQATGSDSEVIIKPRAIFRCPFRKFSNIVVLCDTYLPNGTPHITNTRYNADRIFNRYRGERPWYGLEQEYFLIDNKTGRPLGVNDQEIKQGQYYCSVGGNNSFGRKIAEDHLNACLYAELKISGINAEVAPGQWEFQIGPAEGIEAGDHLWIARYFLERITEEYGVRVEWRPKPIKGDVNGSGCHCNFSTENMREGTNQKTGLKYIEEAIDKLGEKHTEHMALYGEGNEGRMTGEHETASYDKFSCGRANRGCSVRIGNSTIQEEKGYFEDRRPASNCDPYLVTSKILETIME